jgi:NitT/TauT family transport system substrate-binding protein
MNIKNIALYLLIALLVCLSGSCSAASSSSKTPIKVGWNLWEGDYTLMLANQMGLFKKYGVSVEPVHYDSSTQEISDLAEAKLDGGLLTMSDALLASNLGEIKVVMVSDIGGQYSIVASPDIKSVNGLRGKRLGLNLHTSSEMFVSNMLGTQRMTANDVTLVEMSPDQISAGIPDQVDAGVVWEPYTTQAIQNGKVVVYKNETDSSFIPKVLVFRLPLLSQRPNNVRAFLKAWNDAVVYRTTHPEESRVLISDATGIPASDLQLNSQIRLFTIEDNIGLFANNPGKDASSIYYIAAYDRDFFIKIGYITLPPDINNLLDPSFLK